MSSSIPSSVKRVLICLENPRACAQIQSVLSRYGVDATSVSLATIPDEREIVGSRLIVTHTAMIGRAVALLRLPVVNIETFIFEKPNASSGQPARQFDSGAFVRRVTQIMASEKLPTD